MKRISILLLPIILVPVIVKADVGSGTAVGIYNDEATCLAELELNNEEENKNATEGYYLTCVEISCVDSEVKHLDRAPMNDNITCANKNKNYFIAGRQSGISGHGGLEEGTACLMEEGENEEPAFVTTYATVIYQYNCSKISTGENYGTPSSPPSTTTVTPDKTEEDVKSPPTGINTYYLVLAISVVLLSSGVYIINKKNLFKKI